MINQKYYNDIAQFPSQFQYQRDVSIAHKSYDRVIVCGMGGSSFRVPLVNDLLVDQWVAFQVEARRGYGLPPVAVDTTLFVVCSYSGNTEEVLDAHDHVVPSWADYVVITAWGKLLERATTASVPIYQIQALGMQPRLCTGYFIWAMSHLLSQIGIVKEALIADFADFMLWSESLSQRAQVLIELFPDPFVPVIYTDQSIWSMARICKIKRNENAKTPAFANVVPEMCHNELSGRMSQTFDPCVMIIDHSLMHTRNRKRMEVMQALLEGYGYEVMTIELESTTMAHQVIELSMLTDYMTYWYADRKGIDPEPVEIIENFKAMLKE